jgi:mycothiol synthase
MKPAYRRYQSEDDFWRMRQFLRHVFVLNGRLEQSWHVARLDYARWHTCLNCAHVRLEEVVFLWEADGEIVAFVMPDGGPGEAHLCVHPEWDTPELEEAMIAVAEEHLVRTGPDGLRRLVIWANSANTLRQDILTGRGYVKEDWPEHQWKKELDAPVPEATLAAGYAIRSLGDGLELLERCYASGLGFHEGDIRVAVDNRTDPAWYRNIQTAPLYRRDLDLVAVAASGEIAAFCTIWFDDVTRSACFEPVACVPAHQRRGLARALMIEGLRRLQRMGAKTAFVGGYSPAANALYRDVMGPDHNLDVPWVMGQ